MEYIFDTPHSRMGTNCYKADLATQLGFPEEATSLWDYDMDFFVPPCVYEALQERVQHPVYGPTFTARSYYHSIVNWMQIHHLYTLEPTHILPVPSFGCGLSMLLGILCKAGDAVLLPSPNQPATRRLVTTHGQQVVTTTLLREGASYELDWADLATKLAHPQVKLMVLSSPHVPTGRVWRYEELRRLGELCLRHHVYLLADERFHDFVTSEVDHTSAGTVSDRIARQVVTCISPGRTFNLGGITSDILLVPDATLRQQLASQLALLGMPPQSPFDTTATTAAYNSGAHWLLAASAYIEDNRYYCVQFLAKYLPQARPVCGEGTYLLWLDLRALGIPTQKQLMRFLSHQAGILAHSGTDYCPYHEGYVLLNLATQRSNLDAALRRLAQAATQLP